MSKVTFGKSEPWHSGWRGWADQISILLDGREIGTLMASNSPNKRHLEYRVTSDDPRLHDMASQTGVGAAKAAVRERLSGGEG